MHFALRFSCIVSVVWCAGWHWPMWAAETFRVATYNLNNYIDEPTGRRPLKTPQSKAKVRESLGAARADVVAFQEIGGPKALQELRSSLKADGLDYPFWEHVQGFDTNIQVGVLSRYPIVARRPHTNDTFLLFGRRFQVSRGFAEVEIQVNPRYTFTLITAHLKSKVPAPEADQAELRLEEAKILREKVDARLTANPNVNLVVLGDLNDTKDTPPIKTIIGRYKNALVDTRPAEQNGDDLPPSGSRLDSPRITWTHFYRKEDSYSRVDYILLSRGMAREWITNETYVLKLPNWGLASDHRPIVASFFAEEK